MKVLITGATGFVGRSLVARLLSEGNDVIAAVRNVSRARNQLGDSPSLIDISSQDELDRAVSQADAVVNLAGEGIFSGRWTRKRKSALRQSRLEVTARLVSALRATKNRPSAFISSSAIGVYGDRGEEELNESSSLSDDFLAQLCRAWEAEAHAAQEFGTRVVILRTGIVMGLGGALERMLPPFRLGLGGTLGSGRQWFSWIHLDDLVSMIITAIHNRTWEGTYNATAPNPVTNKRFTKTLGQTLGKWTPFPVPAFALQLILGEAANALLGGQRVLPTRAIAEGFSFDYPNLAGAFRRILEGRGVVIERINGDWQLKQQTYIPRSRTEVFSFFSRPTNLGMLTPQWMGFQFQDNPIPTPEEGAKINYKVRIGPFKMSWQSQIESWVDNEQFVDVQTKGPYSKWHHEHRFVDDGRGVQMVDTVTYRVPLGPLGLLGHMFFVRPLLESIFRHRATVVGQRFGERNAKRVAA